MPAPFSEYNASATRYRYGFNGKENDNDVKGNGNQQDYGMRIYDPRLGRFLTVDPIAKDYPELTPYQFASNRSIDGIDQDGLEFIKGKVSVYGLNKFENIDSKYTLGHLWQKNQEIHKIVLQHEKIFSIVNEGSDSDPGEALDLSVDRLKTKQSWNKKQEAYRQRKTFNQNAKNAAGDFAGAFMDAIKFGFSLYGNLMDKKALSEAYESLVAVDKSDKLVRMAINAPSFPNIKHSLSNSFNTDLVNFVTDGSLPSIDKGLQYRELISTWGLVIFNNKDAIECKSFDFSSRGLSAGEQTLNLGSGVTKTIRFRVPVGNPDPILKRANDLLSQTGLVSSSTIKAANK